MVFVEPIIIVNRGTTVFILSVRSDRESFFLARSKTFRVSTQRALAYRQNDTACYALLVTVNRNRCSDRNMRMQYSSVQATVHHSARISGKEGRSQRALSKKHSRKQLQISTANSTILLLRFSTVRPFRNTIQHMRTKLAIITFNTAGLSEMHKISSFILDFFL
jgi:hypothetical protein